MKEEKLEKMLDALAERTSEPVRSGLAEEIKQHIPHRLTAFRKGLDTVNIIVDLRINKLVAAAAIIIAMILLASLFGGRNSTDGGMIREAEILVEYLFGKKDTDSGNIPEKVSTFYEYQLRKGRQVVIYSDNVDPEDSNSIWMHWKVDDGRYGVIFGDLREKEVGADELIELQVRMLQKKAK
ncbi:MAG: hypothetical protein ACYTBJ_16575 [Planctomycetota bacterium]|jgi:hypothetical protein